MKRYLLGSFIFIALNGRAQNIFPSSGNIGIGTIVPVYKFHSYAAGNSGATSAFIAGDYYGPVVGL